MKWLPSNNNVDLIAAAAQVLAGMKTQTMRLSALGSTPVKKLQIDTDGIDRVDVLIDSRPVSTFNVKSGTNEVTLPAPVDAGSTIKGDGYRSGELVVSSRLRL